MLERFGKVCILSVLSHTPWDIEGEVSINDSDFLPLTGQGGALTGNSSILATGEMYIYTNGRFAWFVNRITEESLYTGQIIYIAKN
ncbi:MAG: hypothetical protein ACRC4T_23755 [Cetobacterium sp.]